MTTTYIVEEGHFADIDAMLCPSMQRAQGQEEIADRLKAMKHLDETSYQCLDCRTIAMDSNQKTNDQKTFFVMEDIGDCRTKICDWFFRASDFLKVRRETIEVAMSFVDRLMANTTSHRASLVRTDRKQYQLASMSAFGLSVKLLEPFDVDCDMLAELSRGLYNAKEFQEMESDILSALSWRVNPPTSVDFLRHFLSLLPSILTCADQKRSMVATLLEASVFQTEVAVGTYDFVTVPKSTLALASLRNSINVIDEAYFSPLEKTCFLRCIAQACNCNPFSEDVHIVMSQLMNTVDRDGSTFPSDCTIWQGRIVSKKTNDVTVSYSSETSSPVCVSTQNSTAYQMNGDDDEDITMIQ